MDEPLSFAASVNGTEIAINRTELNIGPAKTISILAYIDTVDGVTAVIPPSARPSTEPILPGEVTFTDSIVLSQLTPDYTDWPVQHIAPILSLENRSVVSHLIPGGQEKVMVSVTNPDVLAYQQQKLSVTLGGEEKLLQFISLDEGATCYSCQPGEIIWTVLVDVAPGETKTVIFTVTAITPGVPGVYTVPVSAEFEFQGIPTAPQPPANAVYTVDYNVAHVTFSAVGSHIFTKSGSFVLPIFTNLAGFATTCEQTVSVNRGDGVWEKNLFTRFYK